MNFLVHISAKHWCLQKGISQLIFLEPTMQTIL
jgi:hypothetical protein